MPVSSRRRLRSRHLVLGSVAAAFLAMALAVPAMAAYPSIQILRVARVGTVPNLGSGVIVYFRVYRAPGARGCDAAVVASRFYRIGAGPWRLSNRRTATADTCRRLAGGRRFAWRWERHVRSSAGPVYARRLCITATQPLINGGVNKYTRCTTPYTW